MYHSPPVGSKAGNKERQNLGCITPLEFNMPSEPDLHFIKNFFQRIHGQSLIDLYCRVVGGSRYAPISQSKLCCTKTENHLAINKEL